MGLSKFGMVALLVVAVSGTSLVDSEPDAVPEPLPSIEAEAPAIDSVAVSTDRLSGPDRYATAVAVSNAAFPSGASRVFLASGVNYPDALSAAPIAAALAAPLLLTDTQTVPDSTLDELSRLGATDVVIVGGPTVIDSAVATQLSTLGLTVSRVSGADRYATSRALITTFAEPSGTLYLATGRNYPDALAAAAAAGSIGAPVLLIDGAASTLDAETVTLLQSRAVNTAIIAGGTSAVSSGVESALAAIVDTVDRREGADRFSTAVALTSDVFVGAERAYVATGYGFADALSGAVLAATQGAPLFLSGPLCLHAESHAALESRPEVTQVTALGGPSVLGARVEALDPCTADDDQSTNEVLLEAAIVSRLSSLPGSYSVSVRELGGLEAAVDVNGSVMQEPASVMKLFVAYAIFDRIDQGLLSLGTLTRSGVNVDDCLRVTLHVSDNYCHWDLVDLIGNQTLNNQFWAEGWSHTVYQGYSGTGAYYASKQTSTSDVASLLVRLHRGELLSPQSTQHFIRLLETQLWRHRLPAGMPSGVPIANKTGHLWVSSGYIHADVGIVSAENREFVVAVIGSRNATAAGVREVGRVVYEHFNGPVTSPASYDALNLVTTRAAAYYRYAGVEQLGVIGAGVRVSASTSARNWYRVGYAGNYVYIHSLDLRNYYDYPRR